MQPADRDAFGELIGGVYDFYGKPCSEFALGVWWNALQPFDLSAVQDALGRHAVNPDNGQFLPRPADVVKMLGGSTLDAAMLAWSKLEKAVMRIGPYQTVAFDDALIHRVVDDMGGWVQFGRVTEEEWPFTQKEFENRYRGYRFRSETPQYPPKLIGIVDGENLRKGYPPEDVVLIGDATAARRVMGAGSDTPRIGVTTVGRLLDRTPA